MADSLFERLKPEQLSGLAAFIGSPQFEHLTLQLLLAHRAGEGSYQSEIISEVREQLRQSLHHAMRPEPDVLYGVASVVMDALVVACESALAQLKRLDQLSVIEVASRAHVAAMGARNGRLLKDIEELSLHHEQGDRLRSQVAAAHATIRLAHIGMSRTFSWEKLYVAPSLSSNQKAGEHVAFGRLTRIGERSVILGNPGAGKSTLASKLAHDVASTDCGQVPYLVVLRDLSEALRLGERTLVQQLTNVARDPYNIEMSSATVEYHLLNGRGIVILDGLDELIDVALRRRVVQLVEAFVRLYPLTPVIATSRQVGYFEAPLDPALFQSYVIEPFGENQVIDYSGKWFQLDQEGESAESHRLSNAFLSESQGIPDLRENPLLLSLLCAMYASEQYLPRNRAQIYERCAVMVFDRWDRIRGVQSTTEFDGRVRGAIQSLAWLMFAELDVSELPRHHVSRSLAKYLKAKRFEEDEARALAEEFLEFCAGRAWVLTEVGSTETEGIYGFAHRTFMEYFAAEYLVRHNPTPNAIWAYLAPRVSQGQWSVVAHLALQLLDRNTDDGADQVVEAALEQHNAAQDSKKELLTLFLAEATGQVTLSPVAIGRIVSTALESVRTFNLSQRFRFFNGADSVKRSMSADSPLDFLMNSSLNSNYSLIIRALREQLAQDIKESESTSDLVLTSILGGSIARAERRSHWLQAREQLLEDCFEKFALWRALEPWSGLIEFMAGDTAAMTVVLESFGVEPFYMSYVFMGRGRLPAAVILGEGGNNDSAESAASALASRLISMPIPWIDRRRWLDEVGTIANNDDGAPWELGEEVLEATSNRIHLATLLVLMLPYIETEAELDVGWWKLKSNQYFAVALAARRPGGPQLRYALGSQIWPEDWVAFVDRWARNTVGVIAGET
ncbi:NACHT domain-containing protein [Micromonospora sp. DT227]|uniref:NACHT domain-containing protein n=1 Tax=Micromonospora sp. DT227 TaxID=3393433 RepID=UPI003CFACA9F